MVSTEVKLLYDFKYVIPGGKEDIVELKSGEYFILHEEKGERWLAVKKSGKEDVYYLPAHYVEQFRIVNDPDCTKSLTPPKPPYKPKNLLRRMQSDNEEPLSPPPIDEDSFIELYNLLLQHYNSTSIMDDKQTQNRFSSGENASNEKLTEFGTNEKLSQTSMPNSSRDMIELSQKKNKELYKKKMPVPHPGEAPLKSFPNGFEMYRDSISGQVFYYNMETYESSWILPRVEPETRHSSARTADQSSFAYSRTKCTSEDLIPHKQNQWTKSGILSRSKLTDNGGKFNKYWNQVFAVLEGSILYFFKDQKSSSNKGKAELTIDLQSSFVLKGGSNNKQNMLHIMSSGSEYLLLAETSEVAQEWFDVLSVVANKGTPRLEIAGEGLIRYKSISEEQSTIMEPERQENLLKSKQKSGSSMTLDQPVEKTTLKEKLKAWLLRRPTQDSLRERGIYKDPIFGSCLSSICKRDGSNIPIFVSNCIEVVEKEGLTVDGIYRVNGNSVEIQKLRFVINQNAPYDLWNMDIHTVTGALKLFFRELCEPLFPFDYYEPLIQAFGGHDKTDEIKHIIEKFPRENYTTLRELIRHLIRVEENSNENRMKSTNLAIVFGPTLLWTRDSCDFDSLAQSLMMRGQLVEFILNNSASLFPQGMISK